MTDVCKDARMARLAGDYQGWLRGQAAAMLGPGHPDTDDLIQEGYIAMWRALDTYSEERGSLAGWLTYRARMRMLECLGRHQWTGKQTRNDGRHKTEHHVTLSLDTPRNEAGSTLADMLDGVDYLDGTELAYHHGEIMAALAALTPAQRKYVEAKFWHGMKESEIKVLFGYDAGSLWRSQNNGARLRLARSLAHLAGVA